jgi:hypothetical protein
MAASSVGDTFTGGSGTAKLADGVIAEAVSAGRRCDKAGDLGAGAGVGEPSDVPAVCADELTADVSADVDTSAVAGLLVASGLCLGEYVTPVAFVVLDRVAPTLSAGAAVCDV